MPKVPRITTQRRLSRPIARARITATGDEAAFGGGPSAERVSQQARQTIGSAQKFFVAEQLKANELAVQDGDAQLYGLDTRIQNQISQLKGRAAAGAPDLALQEWTRGLADIEKTLSNDAQRETFRRVARDRFLSLQRSTNRYVSGQLTQYDNDSTNAFIDNARQSAARNADDNELIAISIGEQHAAIRRAGARNGTSKEEIARQISEATSATHRDVIIRLLGTGQTGAAEAYAKKVESDLRSEHVDLIGKARKAAKQQADIDAEAKDKDRSIRMLPGSENPLTLEEIDNDLRNGDMTPEKHAKYFKRLTDVNNDDRIPAEEKAATLYDLSLAFIELNGATDPSLRPIKKAEGNRLEDLIAFRDKVRAAAPWLTEKQESDYYLYTEANLSTARPGKANLFQNVLRFLTTSPMVVVTAAISEMMDAMNPSVPIEEAVKTTERVKAEIVNASNPNRTRYTLDEIITNPNGLKAKVVGFDEHGDPVLKWQQ